MLLKKDLLLNIKCTISKITEWMKNHPVVNVFILSFLLVVISEILNRRSFYLAGCFLFYSFPIAFLNVMIVFSTVSTSFLTKKQRYWKYFILLAWLVLSVINFVIFIFRRMPFSFTDILLLPSTFTVLPVYLRIWQMILIGFLTVFLVCALVCIYLKSKKYSVSYFKSIVFYACICIFTACYFFVCKQSGLANGRVTGLIGKYESNGFVYCFTSSMIDRGMNEPDYYSNYDVAEVISTIENSKDFKKTDSNVIFIQLESFFDVNNVKEVEYSQNPIPVFSSLKKDFSHGYLDVPTYSAGTANTEFEVLTGMNTDYFGIGEFPYQTVAAEITIESVAHCMKNNGYTAHAVHNNSASFYDRNIVYSNLGFDTFTSIEYMYNPRYTQMGWAKDEILVSGIVDALKSTKGKDFVYTVSVQSHGVYPDEACDDKIKVSGISDESLKNKYSYYVNQLYEVDRFIGLLISELEFQKENTVIVLFGDHLPGIDIENTGLSNKSIYQTEYVIWSNFEMDYTVKNLESHQLYSYILGRLNLEGGYISKLHRHYDYNKSNAEYNKNFEMLQYHLLYADRSSPIYKSKVYKPSDLRMGILEIKISGINIVANDMYVHGENFNEFTKVFFNDDELETEFLNRHTLLVKNQSCNKNDKVKTGQVDSKSNVLSYSEVFTVK